MSKEVGDGKLEKRKKSTKVKGKKLSTDTDRSEDVDETDEVTHACRLSFRNSFEICMALQILYFSFKPLTFWLGT